MDYLPSGTADAAGTVDPQAGPGATTALAPALAGAPGQEAAVPHEVVGYEVLGVLGRGAMGVVYRARQRGLKRLVALKMVLTGPHAGARELERFRTEAEAVARLQHPNIVQIYEVGEENGLPFFSLELVEGDSLARKIAGTPQPPREAARLLHLLAGAMQAAHDKGIVHRDLKPANILMTLDGEPKITDFGLAKRLEEDAGQTHSGTVLGTPSYMAPEQADGRVEDVGPWADVYSLGAILYELLTGRVPFRAPTIRETLALVRDREPVAPTQLQPKVPRDLETICLKCLQKDARQRYASAAALAEDLRRFLGHEPILARPVGRLGCAWRWCRRNPLGAAVVGLVAAWALTMSVLAWGLKVQKEETERARIEADRQAETAAANAEQARANAEQARANAKEAAEQHTLAVKQMARLGEVVQRKLSGKRFAPQVGPEVRVLEEEVQKVLQGEMLAMARSIEAMKGTSFGILGTYQEVGDALKRLGKGEEALQHIRRGQALAEQLARDQPDSDKARANLSVMVYRVGDMELELHGDARAAHDNYRKARDLQQEIVDRPHSGEYDAPELKIMVSHTEVRLGKVELELGRPAPARDHFRQAVALRKAWLGHRPDYEPALSYLSEAYLWLGVAAAHLEDARSTMEAFDEAVRLTDGLVRKHPHAFWFKADLADIYGHLGDAQRRLGRTAEAAKSFRLSWDYLQPALERVPEQIAYQELAALAHERLAGLPGTERQEAEKHYREALRLRAEFVRSEPGNRTWQAAYLVALAHCGRHAEAATKAEEVLRRAPTSIPLALQAARCFAACAAAVPESEQKQQYAAKAAGALRAAVGAGCEDAAALRTDPDLAPLARDPALRLLPAAQGTGTASP